MMAWLQMNETRRDQLRGMSAEQRNTQQATAMVIFITSINHLFVAA